MRELDGPFASGCAPWLWGSKRWLQMLKIDGVSAFLVVDQVGASIYRKTVIRLAVCLPFAVSLLLISLVSYQGSAIERSSSSRSRNVLVPTYENMLSHLCLELWHPNDRLCEVQKLVCL